MLRFYRGQSRQFRKESPVFLVTCKPVTAVHSTCHSDILTFDASLQQKKYKHRKKNKHVFLLVFFMLKKKKNGPPTFNIPTFSFHQNLVPGAACFLMLLLAWNSLAGTGRSFTAALTLLGANGVKDGTPMDLVGKIHENKNIC